MQAKKNASDLNKTENQEDSEVDNDKNEELTDVAEKEKYTEVDTCREEDVMMQHFAATTFNENLEKGAI